MLDDRTLDQMLSDAAAALAAEDFTPPSLAALVAEAGPGGGSASAGGSEVPAGDPGGGRGIRHRPEGGRGWVWAVAAAVALIGAVGAAAVALREPTPVEVQVAASSTTIPPPTEEALVVEASVRRLLTVDNSFGTAGNPFGVVWIRDTWTPADPLAAEAGRGEPLPAATLGYLQRQLADLGDVRVSANPPDPGGTSPGDPGTPREAVVGLAAPVITGARATVRVSLSCGPTCGTYSTYVVERQADGTWRATGTDGPVAVS